MKEWGIIIAAFYPWSELLAPANIPNWFLVVVGFWAGLMALRTLRAIDRQGDHMVATDRAWILVEIEWDRTKWTDNKLHLTEGSGSSGDHTLFDVVLVCRNEGKSPAWIDEKRATGELFAQIPAKPNLDATEIIQVGPEPIGVGQATKITKFIEAEGHRGEGTTIVVYGVVKYRDPFGTYETTFGYHITPNGPVRLEGHPKYNRNT